MHSEHIKMSACYLDHFFIPSAPACTIHSHFNEPDALINSFHRTCEFDGLERILYRIQMPQLPPAIHFIPNAPKANAIWFAMPIAGAHLAPSGAHRAITILHPFTSFVCISLTSIDAYVWLASDKSAELNKFIGAKIIPLPRIPCPIPTWRASVGVTNAIAPVIPRYKVTTRPTDNRWTYCLDGINHVSAHAMDIISGH